MSETRFVAFYSFKGGVGRSMTLANVAYHLAKEGKRVLVVDFDLEAPGQSFSDLFRGISVSKGVLELLTAFVEASNSDGGINRFLDTFDLSHWTAISPLSSDKTSQIQGTIALLPAGNFEDPSYERRLADFKWDSFYQQRGRAFIEILKERIRAAGYDYVLLDSRTGLTDVFYVTTLDFADTVVMMSGLNRQNVAGIRKAYEMLQSPKANELYGPRHMLLVASPVPDVPLDDRRRRQNDILNEWPDAPPFDVFIPYVGELALTERLLSYEADYLRQPTSYGQQCADLTARIVNRTVTSTPQSDVKPSNPFSIVRRDYISEDDLVRYYVDPGNVTVDALQEFPPVIVTGARGSGKTTLASIFSLEAWLARARAEGAVAHQQLPAHIGLYFRIDADILRSFAPADDAVKLYEQLFNQYLDLTIAQKAIRVLDKLSPLGSWLAEERLFRRMYQQFGFSAPESGLSKGSFLDFIEDQLTLVTLILNNPDKKFPELTFAQPNALLKILAAEVGQSEILRDHYLAISIDEFENFLPFQQRVVNTRLKQTKREDGVTWRLFSRSEVFLTAETLTNDQRIEETHDFRSYSLDEVTFAEFEVHVTRVANRHLELNPFFKSLGVNDIQQLLAALSDEEEALLLKNSGRKLRPLIEWVEKSFPDDVDLITAFIEAEPNFLRAATAIVVMNQGSGSSGPKSPSAVIKAFRRDDAVAKDWYANYKRGALFWLCTLYRKNKLYAGQAALLGLSGRNMRYFLDFCNRVVAQWLSTYDSADRSSLLPISPSVQDEAIRSQAVDYQRNVQRTDKSARQLYQLIERLGRVFEAAHKSPRQSEPEINHFAIKETGTLSETDRGALTKYLHDAVFEDVLKQLPGTKQKNLRSARLDAWQLAPRFAPLFDLSTRKKKSLDLTEEDLFTLFSGTDDAWGKLFNKFKNRFSANELTESSSERPDEVSQPRLF